MFKKNLTPLENSYSKNGYSLTGFTLLELITVIIIIGILASLGMGNLNSFKTKTLEKEAKANLILIHGAEKIYRMETGNYYPSAGYVTTSDINTNLKLALSTNNWTYGISPGFTLACAKSVTDPSNCWYVTISSETPHTCSCTSSGCP